MRISDIINEALDEQVLDEFSDMDRTIYKALKKKGYKYLGSGVDQAAFMEPGTGLVLKIFGTQGSGDFSSDHKMFFKWAKFCERNKTNPFLPKFYGHESFLWPNPDEPTEKHRYLMIRTEILRESGDLGRALASLSDQIGFNRRYSFKETIQSFKQENPQSYNLIISRLGERGFNDVAKTMQKLHDLGERQGWGWDLHRYNIMMRPDGTPILNDPWVL